MDESFSAFFDEILKSMCVYVARPHVELVTRFFGN